MSLFCHKYTAEEHHVSFDETVVDMIISTCGFRCPAHTQIQQGKEEAALSKGAQHRGGGVLSVWFRPPSSPHDLDRDTHTDSTRYDGRGGRVGETTRTTVHRGDSRPARRSQRAGHRQAVVRGFFLSRKPVHLSTGSSMETHRV